MASKVLWSLFLPQDEATYYTLNFYNSKKEITIEITYF